MIFCGGPFGQQECRNGPVFSVGRWAIDSFSKARYNWQGQLSCAIIIQNQSGNKVVARESFKIRVREDTSLRGKVSYAGMCFLFILTVGKAILMFGDD